MQKSLKEIIKQIATLEQQKEEVLNDEVQNSITRHENNEDIPVSDYNFIAIREEIGSIDKKTRYLRHKLHVSNATVQIPEFSITIGECIIMMAQLSKEQTLLKRMARKENKERRQLGFGNTVEWVTLNYDKDECRNKLKEISEKLTSLQITIDRTNLTHLVDVEIFE